MAGESAPGRAEWLLPGLAPGSVLAGYRLEARIGAGGMAMVFRARDEALGRTVALKVLAPALAGDAEFRERFIRESRAAAAVDHPHIIPVYAAGDAGGVLYIAMRFIGTGDLRSVSYREGALAGARTAFLLSPVASALDAAHAAGLVHRDVKPANILVDSVPGRPDHPYLSDFGLAKGAASASGLTGTGQFLGTADYAAPEQIAGGPADPRTDQYALACVAFTLLTGTLPFAREQPMAVLWAHLQAPPPSVTAVRPDLPATIDRVLARALAKNPGDRYASCGDFTDTLRAALGVTAYAGVAAGDGGPGYRQPQRSVRGPAVAGAPSPAGSGPWQVSPAPQPTGFHGATAPSAPVLTGWGVEQGAYDLGTGATEGRRRLPGLTRRWPAARTGVVAVAAALAAVGAVAAVLLPGHGAPQQKAGAEAPASTGSISTGGAAPGTTPTGTRSVGKPRRFVNPGSVPTTVAAFQPTGELVTVGTNGTAFVWDMRAHLATAQLSAPAGEPFQRAVFGPEDTALAAQVGRGTIYIFHNTAQPTYDVPATGQLYPGSLSSAGLTLITTDRTRTHADIWSAADPTPNPVLSSDPGTRFTSVAISSDATTAVTSDDAGHSYLWDISTHTRAPLSAPGDGATVDCSLFTFTPTGKLATGDSDGRAYLFDIASGAPLGSVRDPNGSAVRTVAFNTLGTLLATAGTTDAVYLWNVATHSKFATLVTPDRSRVRSVVFNDLGTQVAVTDRAGATYVWNIPQAWNVAGF